jgi:hypothetical protein
MMLCFILCISWRGEGDRLGCSCASHIVVRPETRSPWRVNVTLGTIVKDDDDLQSS